MEIELTIKDWSKFNPRTDSKSHSWFRLEHNFFTKTFSWGAEVQRLFLYLCSMASQNKSETFKCDIDLAASLLKRESSQVIEDLKKLLNREVIESKAIKSNIKLLDSNIGLLEVKETITQSQPVPTNVRTDVTNVRTYSVGQNSEEFVTENNVSKFIGVYVKAFQKRFPKGRPTLTGKIQGQIKRFLKDYPFQRACDLIQIYFQMDEKWFETKAFDFTTFIENLQKVELALDTGQQVKPKTGIDSWAEDMRSKQTGSVVPA